MVKVVINGIEIVETPEGWEDLTTTLRMDKELKALFEIMDISLTFYFDGYKMLKAAFDANGYCFSYPAQILHQDETGNYIPIYDGTLFFKDIDFTEGIEGFSAKCTFTDNSFFAKIYNNRNIKAKIYVGRSKSDVVITQSDYWRITFFTPSTGVYYTHLTGAGYERNDTGFKVYEVLRFLVAFMSDGQIDFISDYFSAGGIGEGAMITCGIVPRFTSGTIGAGLTQELFEENFPDLSFADVLKELDKQYNLGMIAGFDGARPYVRIENNGYLFPNTALQNLPNVGIITRKTALEYLYAKVKIGSDIVTDETFLSFAEYLQVVGFKSEEYAVVQDCNTDRELDLVNSWIVSSNTIEDLTENPTTVGTSNDSEIVLVNTVLDNVNYWGDAVKSNWIGTAAPTVFYNEIYNNENKLRRYLGGIPAPIAAYLIDANRFRATTTATTSLSLLPGLIYNPSPFDDDSTAPNFNNGGNYDNTVTNYCYNVPVNSVYTFVLNLKIFVSIPAQLAIRVVRWDSTTAVFKGAISFYYNTPPVGLMEFNNVFGTLYAETGDKIIVQIDFDSSVGLAELYLDSSFELTSIGANGGIVATFNPADFPIIRNKFNYPMSFTDFRTLKAQPLGLLHLLFM